MSHIGKKKMILVNVDPVEEIDHSFDRVYDKEINFSVLVFYGVFVIVITVRTNQRRNILIVMNENKYLDKASISIATKEFNDFYINRLWSTK